MLKRDWVVRLVIRAWLCVAVCQDESVVGVVVRGLRGLSWLICEAVSRHEENNVEVSDDLCLQVGGRAGGRVYKRRRTVAWVEWRIESEWEVCRQSTATSFGDRRERTVSK